MEVWYMGQMTRLHTDLEPSKMAKWKLNKITSCQMKMEIPIDYQMQGIKGQLKIYYF